MTQVLKFDLNTLKEYISELKIDAIAITNHNLFDLKQYRQISDKLEIKVFPGIEIDLEDGHILVITMPDKSEEFSVQCDNLKNYINEENQYIDFDIFIKVFPNYGEYLLIPHIGKRPILREVITADKTAREFQILSDGTIASTKLNLIVGSRSSGKTHTLKSIKDTFGDSENVKYIRQFDIVKNCDDKNFNKMIEMECESIVERYQGILKRLIEEIIVLDKDKIDSGIDTYISTLKEFSMNQATSDVFSRTKVFNEEVYSIYEPNEIKKVLETLIYIYTNKTYKENIEKYIEFNNLEKLIIEIMALYNKECRIVYLKREANSIIEELQKILSSKSSKTSPTQCDFNQLWLDKSKINTFDSLLKKYKIKQIIYKKELPRFSLTISKYEYENISSLKKINKSLSMSLMDEFKYYNQPYIFLTKLKNAGVPQADLYKCLVGFKYSITNDAGVEISGGERAEYKLEKEIKDAVRYDVLLVDELESSFDNLFIKNHIIKMIKEISNKTTVFLVTHNNTLGPLLYPNWVIYTECKEGKFKIYYGPFEAKKLKAFDGQETPNIDVLLNTMEAGETAYIERKNIYENIKN